MTSDPNPAPAAATVAGTEPCEYAGCTNPATFVFGVGVGAQIPTRDSLRLCGNHATQLKRITMDRDIAAERAFLVASGLLAAAPAAGRDGEGEEVSDDPAMLSPTEKHMRLQEASRRYLDGDITVDEFEDAERRYLPDYRGVALDLMVARRPNVASRRRWTQRRR